MSKPGTKHPQVDAAEAAYAYLPREVKVVYSPRRVQGDLPPSESGEVERVMFALYQPLPFSLTDVTSGNITQSSFLIVANLDGTLEAATVTTDVSGPQATRSPPREGKRRPST